MKTVALRAKPRIWRLILFCFFCLAVAFAMTLAEAAAPSQRDFWVRDNSSSAPARRAHATLLAAGARALVYVEDRVARQLSQDFLNRLEWQLDSAAPAAAYQSDVGIVPLEERIYGALPKGPAGEDRLVVLFTDAGSASADTWHSLYDQFSDADAMEKYRQHSNEGNVVYVNGFQGYETRTTASIARELEALLSSGGGARESWLERTAAEGAQLLTGFFVGQDRVNQFATDTGKFPLVSPASLQGGPQLLFASFLIDTLPLANGTAMGGLSRVRKTGRDAVEELVQSRTEEPLNFDAIFSNFVSYVFSQADGAPSLPGAWRHSPGITLPKIAPFFTYQAGSGELSASLAPYSFVAIDLAQELSPAAIISVERVAPEAGITATPCAASASVLWKPVNKPRLAIYAVGCDPTDKPEMVQFRLKILDHPSLFPAGPFKISR